jgi:hypothetical protein
MTKEAYLAFKRGLFRKQRYAHTQSDLQMAPQ